MANHTKNIVLSDLQQQILSDSLHNEIEGLFALNGTDGSSTNADSALLLEDGDKIITGNLGQGLDDWIQGLVVGKVNNSWKKFQNHWTSVLINDASYTDGIPSVQADFIALILARADYKNANGE